MIVNNPTRTPAMESGRTALTIKISARDRSPDASGFIIVESYGHM